ncbi:Protein of unknown function (DUF3626) [Seminavis robusta]|uniref:Uncharacterized protein n=1 Tax=Seminavis robusta TaxID=568900 RepID=A0A9N8HK50_9STRA|nr:Protein of unknown function (DUF3626) [Seminavis robusta]|eukprot:Sro730_g194140.1 Protein of unknown function (DUF3626) (436) ;mRNA; r:47732-49134
MDATATAATTTALDMAGFEELDRTVAEQLQREEDLEREALDDAMAQAFQHRGDEDKQSKAMDWQGEGELAFLQQLQWEEELESLDTFFLDEEEEDQKKASIEQEECDRAVARQLQRDEQEEDCDMAVARQLQRDEQEEQMILDMVVAQEFQRAEEEQGNKNHSLNHPSKQEVFDLLVPSQKNAIDYVKRKAKDMHNKSLPKLQSRFINLGFTPEDLQQCLDYIQDDATIVIHLRESTLSLLVKDTHYRNLFETNTSGGTRDKSARGGWESHMFGGCYNSSACFDRPKYGCLNVSGDVRGVRSARSYGNIFMILQPNVRYRSTFFSKDTGAFVTSATLATHEFYAHVLDGYSNDDLSSMINVCKSARAGGIESNCRSYKEVQIHGPVCLATDIQALSVPGRYQTASEVLKKDVLEFQKKANCNILWQDDLLNPEAD